VLKTLSERVRNGDSPLDSSRLELNEIISDEHRVALKAARHSIERYSGYRYN
jgi:hypothetical protein